MLHGSRKVSHDSRKLPYGAKNVSHGAKKVEMSKFQKFPGIQLSGKFFWFSGKFICFVFAILFALNVQSTYNMGNIT